jgi:hypothetical protein
MYTHIIINKENVIIICMNTRVQIKINQFVCWSGTYQNQKKKKKSNNNKNNNNKTLN